MSRLNPLSEEFFISAGMFDQSPSRFALRIGLIASIMLLLASSLYRTGMLTDPYRLALLVLTPTLPLALSPYLARLNMGAKLERDMWAYLATLWLLQRAKKSLSESFKAAGEVSDDEEVKTYFRVAAARLKAAGTLEGLRANLRYCPSSAWRRIYRRLADYFFTRGEAVDEMLGSELHDTINRTMQDLRRNLEMVMVILIIYVLVSTVFPFVVTLLYTFQALVSGFGGGGMSNLALMSAVLPSPMFIALFKILAPRYYRFDGETMALGWGAFAAGFMGAVLASYYVWTVIPPIGGGGVVATVLNSLRSMSIWLRATFGLLFGGLAGWLAVRGREARLRGEALDYPLFLQDLFVELRGGRSFCKAVEDMKASYRTLREFMTTVKYWARLRLPYTDILRWISERQRQSISRMATLLIMTALDAGVELKEAFGTISQFMTRVRELWLEAEAEKRGNYVTAILSFTFAVASIAILVRLLSIPIAPTAAEVIKSGLMLQGFLQALIMGLSLGVVRTGHLTSSFREIFILSIPTIVSLALVQAWSPPPLTIGGA